jgi:hypothetical protein
MPHTSTGLELLHPLGSPLKCCIHFIVSDPAAVSGEVCFKAMAHGSCHKLGGQHCAEGVSAMRVGMAAALAAVAALAVVVNAVELLCTAGLPAVYTAVLSQQNLAAAAHYGYLGLYIVGYIADDALMVGIAVLALSSNKLTEGTGRWLKLISGAVMVALALLLLLRPGWLF